MIKYVEFDRFDEYGQHIIPVHSASLIKTASSNYSPELAKAIANLKRDPKRYYVVVNALGSQEYWGCNRNGDGFPESGLSHLSLRTDMSTVNDYGYKTFEYYAKFYLHHVNKDPSRSFGEVVFSYWNALSHRVELVIAIDIDKAKDIVDAMEAGEQIAVSMGCKVKYDRCSICDNKASTREQYCLHLKNYMREIVDTDLAAKWSKETGKRIIPGMQVFAYNDFPKFFDLSRVYIGADRTSFALGKAASVGHTTFSADIARVYGVTDSDIDKISMVKKEGDIDKEVGAVSPSDIDGRVQQIDNHISSVIENEPLIDNSTLDRGSAALPLSSIFATLLGLGIQPRPQEFQRIILVKIGHKQLADELEKQGICFNPDSDTVRSLNFSKNDFVDGFGKMLMPYIEKRSSLPTFLLPKIAGIPYTSIDGNDYWMRSGEAEKEVPFLQQLGNSQNSPLLPVLGGVAALYMGLKAKALGYGISDLSSAFMQKPWLRGLIGGGVLCDLYGNAQNRAMNDPLLGPASNYAGMLRGTNMSGHVKTSGLDLAIFYPMSHINKSYQVRGMQKSANCGSAWLSEYAKNNQQILLKSLDFKTGQ